MNEELDFFFRLFDNLGSFGLLALIVFAFFKGWVRPTAIQARIDLLQEQHQQQIAALYDRIIKLQQDEIVNLKKLAEEREARTEQGVRMLSTYVEAQDTLSKIADHLKERNNYE